MSSEKHIYKVPGGAHAATGEEDIVFSETEDAHIRSIALHVDGPAFASNEFGKLYLWRDDGLHYTTMLIVAPNTQRDRDEKFEAGTLVIPAGVEFCAAWSFTSIVSGGRLIYFDILYDLVTPP